MEPDILAVACMDHGRVADMDHGTAADMDLDKVDKDHGIFHRRLLLLHDRPVLVFVRIFALEMVFQQEWPMPRRRGFGTAAQTIKENFQTSSFRWTVRSTI